MLTRRATLLSAAAMAGTGLSLSKTQAAAPIAWKHFPTGENNFFRTSTVLTGDRYALLIDGGFILPDGEALATAIKATGRTLHTVYVSQSDPDYYFNLSAIKARFPETRVIAAAATVEAIKATAQKKIDIWGPKLKAAGPQKLSDIVMPSVSDDQELIFEGAKIEIVTAKNLPNRRTLFVPSLNAFFGGVLVFSGLHVWTADAATPALRAAWIAELEAMIARKPSIVVAGHAAPGAPTDASSLTYTRDYLQAFERELGKAKDAAALIDAMKALYPNAGLGVALDIGAKVAKGEMKWG